MLASASPGEASGEFVEGAVVVGRHLRGDPERHFSVSGETLH
jgi:hypothetical protein